MESTGPMKTSEMKPHVAESTHWYSRSGEPAYEVEGKTGRRPTTLRDARKLGLVPSVTTIIKSASAPALELWKAKQVMLAAMTLPRNPDESDDSFCARVMHDSKEQARKAAARGTAIHAAIQGQYEGEIPDEADWPFVKGCVEAIHAHCEDWPWCAESSFAHPLGFGGKCDLSSKGWVIDFKTKEFAADADLSTWDEHAMQLAAYREGLGLHKARCAIVYVSTTTPGLAKVLEIPEDELARGWTMFNALLHYWSAKNKYWGRFEITQEAA